MRRRLLLGALLALGPMSAGAATPPRRRRKPAAAPPPDADDATATQPAQPPTTEHKAEVTSPTYDPAPMPDQDAASPGGDGSTSEGLAPTIIRRPQTFRGDAFSSGDSVANSQTRNQKPVVGFSVTSPMQ